MTVFQNLFVSSYDLGQIIATPPAVKVPASGKEETGPNNASGCQEHAPPPKVDVFAPEAGAAQSGHSEPRSVL